MSKEHLVSSACILIVVLGWSIAYSGEYYVDGGRGDDANSGLSPDDAWKTITHAMSVAKGTEQDPSVINLASGTYSASTGETFPISVSYSHTSLLGRDRSETVIDAEQTDYVFSCHAWSGVLSGLTITGGVGSGLHLAGAGSHSRIENCAIRGNTGGLAGGLLITEVRHAELSDCIISDNYAIYQGGGMCSLWSNVKVTRCQILSNVAPIGAGIAVGWGSLELVDSVVAYNTATDDTGTPVGGGVYASLASWRQAKVTNCLFLSNASLTGPGGAVYVHLTQFNEARALTFSCCTFFGNTAPEGGAALCAKMEEGYSLPGVEMTDCIFRDGGDQIWEEEPRALRAAGTVQALATSTPIRCSSLGRSATTT